MNRRREFRSWLMISALLLLPSLALAEVSVQLDGRGNYKRYWYLTLGRGRAVVWGQVRPRLPQHLLLNPLGDTYGDKAPVIQVSPLTGRPWVVWPKNYGNIRQLAFATWEGARWTEPALVNPGAPLVYDDRDPALAIDAAGTLYLVWWRAEQTAKVYFSTLTERGWTPALLLSNPEVDSRTPSIALDGSTATITYGTPSGPVTMIVEASILVQSGASLMDNPIPPLLGPPSTPGGGDAGTGADFVHRR